MKAVQTGVPLLGGRFHLGSGGGYDATKVVLTAVAIARYATGSGGAADAHAADRILVS